MRSGLTQKETVLRLLRSQAAVCGTVFLDAHIPRYSARILELRLEGHTIDKRRCKIREHWHASIQYEYVYVPAQQPSLFEPAP